MVLWAFDGPLNQLGNVADPNLLELGFKIMGNNQVLCVSDAKRLVVINSFSDIKNVALDHYLDEKKEGAEIPFFVAVRDKFSERYNLEFVKEEDMILAEGIEDNVKEAKANYEVVHANITSRDPKAPFEYFYEVITKTVSLGNIKKSLDEVPSDPVTKVKFSEGLSVYISGNRNKIIRDQARLVERDAVRDVEQDLSDASYKIFEHEHEADKFNDRLESMRGEGTDQKNMLKRKFDEIEVKKDKEERDIKLCEMYIQMEETEITKLQKDLERFENEPVRRKRIEEQILDLKNNVDSNKQEIEEHKENINEFYEEKSSVEESLREFAREESRKVENVADLENSINQRQQRIQRIENQLEKEKERIQRKLGRNKDFVPSRNSGDERYDKLMEGLSSEKYKLLFEQQVCNFAKEADTAFKTIRDNDEQGQRDQEVKTSGSSYRYGGAVGMFGDGRRNTPNEVESSNLSPVAHGKVSDSDNAKEQANPNSFPLSNKKPTASSANQNSVNSDDMTKNDEHVSGGKFGPGSGKPG